MGHCYVHFAFLFTLMFTNYVPLLKITKKMGLNYFLMRNYILHNQTLDCTSAVLRLECSIDCISGSVGHQQNIFRSFSHCQRFC